jgi:hypothetical protein
LAITSKVGPMPSNQIALGERFRDVQPSMFARSGLEWIVEDVRVGSDGIEHARLVCASDATERKTLSVSALRDQRRFLRIDE